MHPTSCLKRFSPARYWSVIFVLFGLWWSTAQADNELILAIHPYQSAQKIKTVFKPLSAYLSKSLDTKVKIRIGKNYQDHINHIAAGDADIAYLGPASYVRLVRYHGNHPILARLEVNDAPTFQGVLVVAAQSPINNLSDLAGKRFAFGDRASTMSHLVPRHMLIESGIDLAGHAFLGSHDNVALAVLTGDFDAGAIKPSIFAKYADRGLKKIALTPTISEHLFITRKDLAPDQITALRNIMLRLNTTTEGKKILRTIKPSITGLKPAHHSHYENLQHMIDRLSSYGIN